MSATGDVVGFVFGYGSLARLGEPRQAQLNGYRRVWGVAMDNRVTLPGYKYYVTSDDAARPAVSVAFLDLLEDPSASVNGVLIPVRRSDLALLDSRERNYERREITAGLADAVDRPVWAYTGSADGRRRFERARAAGHAVLSREYCEAVIDAFAALGPDALAQLQASLGDPPCPVVDLTRVDLA